MWYAIWFVAGAVVGFVAATLVWRKNKDTFNRIDKAADELTK